MGNGSDCGSIVRHLEASVRQILQKSPPKEAQEPPRRHQNGLPNHQKLDVGDIFVVSRNKVLKKYPLLNDSHPLGRPKPPNMVPKAPQMGPKWPPNR